MQMLHEKYAARAEQQDTYLLSVMTTTLNRRQHNGQDQDR